MKTILILKESKTPIHYIVNTLAETWKALGCRVIEHAGVDNPPGADVLFLHVDRTVVPDEFLQLASRYPVAVNGRACDISRRLYSTARLSKSDGYAGPVIVKTNANYGGMPEDRPVSRFAGLARLFFRKEHAAARRQAASWRRLTALNPRHYPIFESIHRVPAGVWKNEHLIVEKFLPEQEGDLHYVRYWTFFGDAGITGRHGSVCPIVKFDNSEASDIPVDVPQELRRVRRMLNLDYGRIDFVMNKGEPVVLDVNKTQGGGAALDPNSEQLKKIALGIESFLK